MVILAVCHWDCCSCAREIHDAHSLELEDESSGMGSRFRHFLASAGSTRKRLLFIGWLDGVVHRTSSGPFTILASALLDEELRWHRLAAKCL